MRSQTKGSEKVVAQNKKARRDYFIDTVYEAGMVLTGPEVKSIRGGRVNLSDGYAMIRKNEVFLYNVHISPYSHATQELPDPLRSRKLLLKRREIDKLTVKTKEKGLALVPLKIYFNDKGKAKLELALVRGKKLYDKRADIKKKETLREIDRSYKKERF